MNFDLHCLEVTEWGWKMQQSQLHPVKTDIEPGPECRLQFVRCKCKSASRNQCASRTCSCRKNGLVCVEACQGCHGETCLNTPEPELPGTEPENVWMRTETFLICLRTLFSRFICCVSLYNKYIAL